MKSGRKHAWYALTVLFAINAVNFFDRLVIGALGEPIRHEFEIGDAALGLLSTAFTLLYAVAGIPFGRLADRYSRKKLLSAGVFVWSLLTAASGLAQNFAQMFAFRLGVGIGEATCAPAATSLIGDLFGKRERGRAISIFMLGLPVGIGLSFAVSGSIAAAYGWRTAFFVAGIPGFLIAIAALLIREPSRGSADADDLAGETVSPFRTVIASPVMRWLIVSGALHNFCLYALSSFMTPYLMRYHELDIRDANLGSMLINGVFTIPGLLFGGVLGDKAKLWRTDGALIVAAAAAFAAAPLFAFAIAAPRHGIYQFVFSMGAAFALMYFYYSAVYSTIQDVIAPRLRGTAMAIYFMAMYLVGGALGPFAVGALSDLFTRRAAQAAGSFELSGPAALEPFRAAGLHLAMYVVPVLAVILAAVLLAAAHRLRMAASNPNIQGKV